MPKKYFYLDSSTNKTYENYPHRMDRISEDQEYQIFTFTLLKHTQQHSNLYEYYTQFVEITHSITLATELMEF